MIGDNFVIALDATGIKVTNRGEWLYQKKIFSSIMK